MTQSDDATEPHARLKEALLERRVEERPTTGALQVRSGRIVASEIEAPNMLVSLASLA